jgi:uncharacterized protein YcgI (DUF1989 family)
MKSVDANDVRVPAYGGAAIDIYRGQFVKIVDLEGMQIGDVAIVALGDEPEYFSQAATRHINGNAYVGQGSTLYSNRGRPMANIVVDSCSANDIVGYPCDNARYSNDFFTNEHNSCRTNLSALLSDHGYTIDDVPDPFNVFMNTRIYEGRRTVTEVPTSVAGEFVILEVMMDVCVAVSACPQDMYPANGYEITDMLLQRMSDVQGLSDKT